jgi:hypothetical protein
MAFDPYSAPARAMNIALRTAHLGAMAVAAGGLAYGVPLASLRTPALLTVATGVALLLSEMSHARGWIAEGRGLFVVAHVGVVGVLAAAGRPGAGVAAALVLGAVGSHLPRAIRRWSLRGGSAEGGEDGA